MSKTDKDGMAKNLEVLKAEWWNWQFQMKAGISRFRGATLDQSSKSNVFHLLTNMIEETYDCLPRTLTYLTILGLVGWAGLSIYNAVV